jgi:hypothetical protein
MVLQIDYLDEHLEALPRLAQWHHTEWSAVTPGSSVADRVVGFHTRAHRGTIPTGFVAVFDGTVADEAMVLRVSMLYLFTFDKQSFYSRLGWSVMEEAAYADRLGTIMLRRLAALTRPAGEDAHERTGLA